MCIVEIAIGAWFWNIYYDLKHMVIQSSLSHRLNKAKVSLTPEQMHRKLKSKPFLWTKDKCVGFLKIFWGSRNNDGMARIRWVQQKRSCFTESDIFFSAMNFHCFCLCQYKCQDFMAHFLHKWVHQDLGLFWSLSSGRKLT